MVDRYTVTFITLIIYVFHFGGFLCVIKHRPAMLVELCLVMFHGCFIHLARP